MDVVAILEANLNVRAKIEYKGMQLGDVKETHADIEHTKKELDFCPTTTINKGIPLFVKWFLGYIKGS